jgi:hypothetical protein
VKPLWLLALGLFSCSEPKTEPPAPAPIFPADFQSSWQEARSCRFSHDHELRSIRVFADSAAFEPYTLWSAPYPVGATIVKIEYEDDECTEVQGLSAMQKLAKGADPELGDWIWQKLDAKRKVIVAEDVPARCIDCHEYHCRAPWGFDLACGEDLPF